MAIHTNMDDDMGAYKDDVAADVSIQAHLHLAHYNMAHYNMAHFSNKFVVISAQI